MVAGPMPRRVVDDPGGARVVALVVLGSVRVTATLDETEMIVRVPPGVFPTQLRDVGASAFDRLCHPSIMPAPAGAFGCDCVRALRR